MNQRPALFCISTYEKGQAFLREAARLDCDVTLLTVEKLRDGDWPKDILAEFLMMPENLTTEQVVNTVTYLARTRRIDRIVALDEFDLENAALLRELMQLPGLGQTTTRRFRDKLTMRTEAQLGGVLVPEFTSVFHNDEVAAFLRYTEGPWMLKPRTNASAIGIRKLGSAEEVWPVLDALGDQRSEYLLERFVPGQVFHVEGVTWRGDLLFAQPFAYGQPPFETMHQGGVFTTRTLPDDSEDARALRVAHARLMHALRLPAGVTHSEFIRAEVDGRMYFLEVAARVGGAYIAETLEFATNVNPWVEWARMEVAAARGTEYRLPQLRREYAGSVISLARQEEPDLSAYSDPEIVKRLHKPHHAGMLVQSPDPARVQALVENYAARFLVDFNAVLAAPEKATA